MYNPKQPGLDEVLTVMPALKKPKRNSNKYPPMRKNAKSPACGNAGAATTKAIYYLPSECGD